MAANAEALARLQAIFSGRETRIREAVRAALAQAGPKLEREVKAAAPVSSGILRSSIGHIVTDKPSLEVGILTAPEGESLIYARIQDLGGRVNARPGGWLAIPLPAVRTKAGVGGIRARDVIANPSQVGVSGTFFGTSRAGNLLLFGKLGQTAGGRQRTKGFRRAAGDGVGPPSSERSSVVPLFLLKGSVTLRGSRYLTGTVEKNLPVVGSFIARRVLQVLQGERAA